MALDTLLEALVRQAGMTEFDYSMDECSGTYTIFLYPLKSRLKVSKDGHHLHLECTDLGCLNEAKFLITKLWK